MTINIHREHVNKNSSTTVAGENQAELRHINADLLSISSDFTEIPSPVDSCSRFREIQKKHEKEHRVVSPIRTLRENEHEKINEAAPSPSEKMKVEGSEKIKKLVVRERRRGKKSCCCMEKIWVHDRLRENCCCCSSPKSAEEEKKREWFQVLKEMKEGYIGLFKLV
ncbi:hypothetical protein MTR_4g007660 [Medicago truncatula]|uniref:Uncharacterized protein n=1 Tax=Medicago truncatula TaxID=3880 RepID=A0A072UHH3_MEDTR|nr:hypothetical protein MTR_4g007660 [Medicago truncatula]